MKCNIKTMFKEVDKLQHMIAGIMIVPIVMPICVFIVPWWASLLIGIASSLIVLGAKEIIWDKWMHKGTCNLCDFIAGAIGVAMITIPLLLLSIGFIK